MNCKETREKLEEFLAGQLGGAEARGIRLHLASCSGCAGALPALDLVEILVMMDDEIEPAGDLQERFFRRLERHRASGSAAARESRFWRQLFLGWGFGQQLAAAGALAAALALGLYLGKHRVEEPASNPAIAGDIAIAESLPLLEDMRVIENLDLLEDFDTIQSLSPGGGSPSTVH
jgi:hypothetical protein